MGKRFGRVLFTEMDGRRLLYLEAGADSFLSFDSSVQGEVAETELVAYLARTITGPQGLQFIKEGENPPTFGIYGQD